jgi:ankyrin repeat protein
MFHRPEHIVQTTQEPTPELIETFVLAAHGNLARVQELLPQHPALLNAVWARTDEDALAAAAHTGQRAIAEYLLSAGAPLTICAAAMLGVIEQVAAFVRDDPSLASARGAHGIPLLAHAAMSGRTDIADLLVAHGGGEGVDSALHGAVAFGHTAMTEWLLARGADVDVRNYEGKTPLRVAVDRGHDEVADLLRRHGAVME